MDFAGGEHHRQLPSRRDLYRACLGSIDVTILPQTIELATTIGPVTIFLEDLFHFSFVGSGTVTVSSAGTGRADSASVSGGELASSSSVGGIGSDGR